MHIEMVKNNGVRYLRLVNSKRITNARGDKVARKQVIVNIGPLSRFDDGQPDYLNRLRASYRNGTPLIESLEAYVPESQAPGSQTYTLTFTAGSDDCIGHPKHYSHSLLDRIFAELGLSALFASIKHQARMEMDLQGLVRLLVFGRILNPASKISTFTQNNDYYPPITNDEYAYHVYDALGILDEHKEKIIQRMNTAITKGLGRNPELVFYDVTNFFFEIDEPDEDFIEGEEMARGLRKMGVSKEHRKQPIVQMGLFMDDMGIPITFEIFPGNTLDQATLRPALDKSMKGLGLSRFILVADRGLCSYKNVAALVKGGNGYIVSKSIRKTAKHERNWILEDDGYLRKGDGFRYKSRQMDRTIQDENGAERTVTEQVVVYWSEAFYKRECSEHRSFLDFIKRLRETPASFRVTAAQSQSIRRFLKQEVVHKDTGEVLDSRKLLSLLDEAKLEEFTAYMGYYQIITSELDMPPLEVIDKYHGLTQIEDQFRVLKGDLETRPVYVRKPEHVKAHLLICMIALTIIRIIQRRLMDSQAVQAPVNRFWSYGLSGERVQRALQRWQIESLPNEFYRFCGCDDPDLKAILLAHGIHIPLKLFSRGDLKSLKATARVFL